jgi:hypothetical protein
MTHRAFGPLKSRSLPTIVSTQSIHHSRGPLLNAPMALCRLAPLAAGAVEADEHRAGIIARKLGEQPS